MNQERVTLVSLCEARGITSEAKHVRFEGRNTDGTLNEWPHDLWNITIAYKGKSHVCEFRTGIGHRKPGFGVERQGKQYVTRMGDWAKNDVDACERGFLTLKKWAPSTADVLYCLALDASSSGESFDSWCADLGYSNDSIKALETYRACQKTRDALLKLFGGELLEELAQAEH